MSDDDQQEQIYDHVAMVSFRWLQFSNGHGIATKRKHAIRRRIESKHSLNIPWDGVEGRAGKGIHFEVV